MITQFIEINDGEEYTKCIIIIIIIKSYRAFRERKLFIFIHFIHF